MASLASAAGLVPESAGPDPCRVRPGGRRRPDARQAQWQASPAGYIAPAQRLSGCVRLRRLAAGNLWKIRSAPGYAERQTRPAGRPDRLHACARLGHPAAIRVRSPAPRARRRADEDGGRLPRMERLDRWP